MASGTEVLHPFHHANIHEHRWAAYIARAMPMAVLVGTGVLVVVGAFTCVPLLMALSAVFNVTMWLVVCSAAMFGIIGSKRVREMVLEDESPLGDNAEFTDTCCDGGGGGAESLDTRHDDAVSHANYPVTHIIVFPNYKEDETMLAETLESLREAEGSHAFWVFLAMEDREGAEGVKKAEHLLLNFSSNFAKIDAVYHPADLLEEHLDGSASAEVPGKASNLKWAVCKAHERWLQDRPGVTASAVLTVADADVLFHPCYFRHVSNEFYTMCESEGEQHKWTMWQAPQLPFRNYYMSPIASRAWGYISSLYEFGGVSSLAFGGHHMVFSAYSVNVELAVDAQLWDGDVIAEDHHAFIKGFFYSTHAAALEAQCGAKAGTLQSCRPALRVRPVMLPVKSTSVISPEGYWATCVERWHQAKRHCQGVAEVSYSLLATWDMLCTLPWSFYNLHFIMTLTKVLSRPFFMHLLPICQTIAMGVLSIYWLAHDRKVPGCPDKIWMATSDGETLLCGLAGAWALTWPVVVPICLLAMANFLFIKVTFVLPRRAMTEHSGSIWAKCDGGIEPFVAGSQLLTLFSLLVADCVLIPLVMVPYGLVAEVTGCWNVMLRGNQFKYISAAKMTGGSGGAGNVTDYGTLARAPAREIA